MKDPMEVRPTLRSVANAVREGKRKAVREGREIDPIIDIYRAGRRVMRISVPTPDDILDVLYSGPAAVCADYICLAADSWGSSDKKNPITGADWEPGDMQRIAEQDLGLHRGLIMERIMACGFERGGDSAGATIGYNHDRDNCKIKFRPIEGYTTGGGRFQNMAVQGFARQTSIEYATQLTGDAPEGDELEDVKRKCAVTWALNFPPHYRVIEGPKGPPLKTPPQYQWHSGLPSLN